MVITNGILAFDLDKFEVHFTCRDIHLYNIAHLVSEESGGKGRGDTDLALFEVGFAFGDDSVGLLEVVLGVSDGDDGEKKHLGGVDFALIQKACIGHKVLEFGDASL